jgi:hypothetical protein
MDSVTKRSIGMEHKIIVGIVLAAGVCVLSSIHATEIITTIYGAVCIDEPVLCDLLKSSPIARLKEINQYGVNAFLQPHKVYTRYQHSVGVMALLRHFGASLDEQIAGLLHDVSHTVFSHVGDLIFSVDGTRNDDYQDDIHLWYLQQTEIPMILKRYGYTCARIHHKNKQFTMLDRPLPDICADRLEYTLYGGYIEGLLTQQDIQKIIHALRYFNGKWFFVDQDLARTFADVSSYLTECIFGAPWDQLVMEWTASAVRHALNSNLLTPADVHFSTDETVWKQLCSSSDPEIKRYIHQIQNVHSSFEINEYGTKKITFKCRVINPLVRWHGFLFRLSTLNNEFLQKFNRIKCLSQSGYSINVRSPQRERMTSLN